MANDSIKSGKRVLEPYDRVAEVLFGLIMVLTFTGSLSVATAGRDDVRAMLVGALGCNFAWGVIDGTFYLMGCLADKGSGIVALRGVRNASDPRKARRIIADALPPLVASALQTEELETIRKRLVELRDPPERASLRRADWMGALGVFCLVVLSTFPVALPFAFMENVTLAMRVSNAIAIALLFALGCVFGRIVERRPLRMGLAMVALGAVLVAVTVVLGG